MDQVTGFTTQVETLRIRRFLDLCGSVNDHLAWLRTFHQETLQSIQENKSKKKSNAKVQHISPGKERISICIPSMDPHDHVPEDYEEQRNQESSDGEEVQTGNKRAAKKTKAKSNAKKMKKDDSPSTTNKERAQEKDTSEQASTDVQETAKRRPVRATTRATKQQKELVTEEPAPPPKTRKRKQKAVVEEEPKERDSDEPEPKRKQEDAVEIAQKHIDSHDAENHTDATERTPQSIPTNEAQTDTPSEPLVRQPSKDQPTSSIQSVAEEPSLPKKTSSAVRELRVPVLKSLPSFLDKSKLLIIPAHPPRKEDTSISATTVVENLAPAAEELKTTSNVIEDKHPSNDMAPAAKPALSSQISASLENLKKNLINLNAQKALASKSAVHEASYEDNVAVMPINAKPSEQSPAPLAIADTLVSLPPTVPIEEIEPVAENPVHEINESLDTMPAVMPITEPHLEEHHQTMTDEELIEHDEDNTEQFEYEMPMQDGLSTDFSLDQGLDDLSMPGTHDHTLSTIYCDAREVEEAKSFREDTVIVPETPFPEKRSSLLHGAFTPAVGTPMVHDTHSTPMPASRKSVDTDYLHHEAPHISSPERQPSHAPSFEDTHSNATQVSRPMSLEEAQKRHSQEVLKRLTIKAPALKANPLTLPTQAQKQTASLVQFNASKQERINAVLQRKQEEERKRLEQLKKKEKEKFEKAEQLRKQKQMEEEEAKRKRFERQQQVAERQKLMKDGGKAATHAPTAASTAHAIQKSHAGKPEIAKKPALTSKATLGQKATLIKPHMPVSTAATSHAAKTGVLKPIQNPILDPFLNASPAPKSSSMSQTPTSGAVGGTLTIVGQNGELPEIASEYSDSEDSDDSIVKYKKKNVPLWAQSPNLLKSLEQQVNRDPDAIFGNVRSCSLEDIFVDSKNAQKFRARASSMWTAADKLNSEEEARYKRIMGFQ